MENKTIIFVDITLFLDSYICDVNYACGEYLVKEIVLHKTGNLGFVVIYMAWLAIIYNEKKRHKTLTQTNPTSSNIT